MRRPARLRAKPSSCVPRDDLLAICAGGERHHVSALTLTAIRWSLVCQRRGLGYPNVMRGTDEGTPAERDEDTVAEERDPAGENRPSAGDPEHNTTPPGNPETDDEAVAKGEQNMGRIAGR